MRTNNKLSRCASLVSALGVAAVAFTALAAPAAAATTSDAQDVIALSWDGEDYTSVIGGSFVGVPVAVPGDSAKRTLYVRNDGPSGGTLNASIVNVKILDARAADTKDNGKDQGNFYDDLRLAWNGGNANFTTLASRTETEIYDVHVDQGQVVPITVDYQFPIEATSGNQANVSKREASFDVRLTISGDEDLPGTETTAPPTAPTADPEPEPSEDPTPEPTESRPGTETTAPTTTPSATPGVPSESQPGKSETEKPQAKPPLANTGAEIWGAVAVGLGLLGLGWMFAARGRRKAKHSN